MNRKATITRKTKETDINLNLNLDGTGKADIKTGIPFIDHMLTLMTAHGFMDIQLTASGDTEIDFHHTVEDLGICLGRALQGALGEKKGIKRYGIAIVPMDEALARVVIDLSNRPFLAYRVPLRKTMTGHFDINLVREFFKAVVNDAGMTLHIDLLSGKDPHHVAESIFKAFGRALDMAVSMEKRLDGAVPSTKGIL
ncbi:MAG: imidazoleglycerol-phosphate dehydratase HisB [Deltaproteobacteria bacterium]|nr:imidazoleglycerol-phosphate dehydratase HisB [Deltaproteobacteria bacterium]